MAQTVLFDDAEVQPLPQLSQDVQIQLLQQMVQWMQAVAVAINKGTRDEQDQR
jgi:hypothetical protein